MPREAERIGRIRIIGICLVGVFATSVTAVANASEYHLAAYELCRKAPKVAGKYTGDYGNKFCTEPKAEGEYRLQPLTKPIPFASKSGKSVLYFYIGPGRAGEGISGTVECAKSKGTGEITNGQYGIEQITYERCKGFGTTCTNVPGTENVKTEELETDLVWLSPEYDLLGKQTMAKGAWAVFNCGSLEIHMGLSRSLLGLVTPVNTGTHAITTTLPVNKATGEPEYKTFWGYSTVTVEQFLISEIGPPISATLQTSEETVEVQKTRAVIYIKS